MMTELPTRFIVILFVLAGLFVATLLIGGGIYIGQRQGRAEERAEQEWADNHLVIKLDENGAARWKQGDEEIVFNEKVYAPIRYRDLRDVAQERETLRDTRRAAPEPSGTEHEDEWGETTTYTFSPRR